MDGMMYEKYCGCLVVWTSMAGWNLTLGFVWGSAGEK